ncbi:F-box domain-containing protein [Pochonia chlamydosporia 170]|uniref:F-box domain-containing protein n=1 Tax=Pochonia chlamydosporia 170 TaxID=1380566 RepID=A0A179G7K0_METCM|nr:F-box domain-containing protein [Pochonia chlamydosporia 170]OAQ73411.1 F-box domain-containing protein [Pochonia chlamydosporia 170]
MLVANARTPTHSFKESPQRTSNFQQASRQPWRIAVNLPSIIERLPHELQRMVFSNLDYQSLIHLSTMNRYFQRTVDPQRMASPTDKAQFVMRAAKDFPQHRPSEKGHDFRPGNFECYICFRVRSPDKFDMLQPQSAFVDIRGCIIKEREPDLRVDKQVMLRAGRSGPSQVVFAVPTVEETVRYDPDESLYCNAIAAALYSTSPFVNGGQNSCNILKCLQRRGENMATSHPSKAASRTASIQSLPASKLEGARFHEDV